MLVFSGEVGRSGGKSGILRRMGKVRIDERVDSEYPILEAGVCWRCLTEIARDKNGWFHRRLVAVGEPCAGNAEPEFGQVSI